MDDSPAVKIYSDHEEVYNLQIKKSDFKEFLEGILGDKRRINKEIPLAFVVEISDLMNLHQRIYQRVGTQNDVAIETFSARIFFTDRVEKVVESKAAFECINETSSTKITSIHLRYTFLIQFKGQPYPEKQQIMIRFNTNKSFRQRPIASPAKYDDDLSGFPEIKIEIDYTNVTWGEDLLEMINRFCYDKFLYVGDRFGDRKLASFVIAWLICFLTGLFLVDKLWFYRDEIIDKRRIEVIKDNTGGNILAHLNALLISPDTIRFNMADYVNLAWVVVPFFSSIIIIILLFQIRKSSFIILNESSKIRLHNEKMLNNLVLTGVVLAFIVGVFAGLTANYLPRILEKYIGLI